jgi:hypothetical protein
MHANFTIFLLRGLFLGVTLAGLPLRAGSNLLENSPFLPAAGAAATAQQTAPLELRSVLKEGGEYQFSLYDAAKKSSTWARLNESGHDFILKVYDSDKETVTVEQKGRTYKLALKEAKIALMTATPGQPPMIAGVSPNGGQTTLPPGSPPQFGSSPPGGGRGPPGSTPSLTPEQLRNLEADINRRRELRRQAASAQPGGAPMAQPTAQP